MKKIKKVICIGGNCYAANITHHIGVRVPSFCDNVANFNIWKSHLLFENKLKDVLFCTPVIIRKSTESEIKNYRYGEYVYTFSEAFSIVHDNFNSLSYKSSCLQRIELFKNFVNESKNNDSLWYIYSLEYGDEKLTDKELKEIFEKLPIFCRNKLICLGVIHKNKLFKNYFNYYLEIEEKEYSWDSEYSFLIKKRIENELGLTFI